MPAVYLGARSLHENLEFLAEKFGFFFYFHGPSERVHFMRIGSSNAHVDIDVEKSGAHLVSTLRSDLSWTDIETRVFHDKELTTLAKKFSSQSLYSTLSSLGEHAGFRGKQSWPFARGQYEMHSQNAAEYDDSERRIKNPLAKKAVFQENVSIICYEPYALPGDQVTLKNTLNSKFNEGKYLVHHCHGDFSSALPSVQISLIRP